MLPLTDSANGPPTTGSGLTLILGHSFAGSRRAWMAVSALLADEYRTIAVDTPGFGEARDVTGYSVSEMVERYAETLRGLDLNRYVLVGHSMTAKVASIIAGDPGAHGLRPPEKLVLLTPTPLGEEPLEEDAREALLALDRNPETADAFIADHSNLPITPDARARAVEDVLRVHPDAWEAWLARGQREDWIDRAAPLDAEALVISAECDAEWGADVQRRLTMPHLRRAELVTVAGSGHLVPLEAPDALTSLLRGFVGR